MKPTVWQLLADEIGTEGEPLRVAGGCINHCAVLKRRGSQQTIFAKTNAVEKLQMFVTEAESLSVLAATNTVCVPEVISCGVVGEFAYLILEHLPIGRGKPRQHHVLGEKLAALHRATSDDGRFGWAYDNVIGETPQPNRWNADWATFFAENRIGFQLELAARDGGRAFAHGDKLVARIPELLAGHDPQPSLLHGDLWSGNAGFTPIGTPVLYDPASYYGDREVDLAFSEMFGGFEPEFYSGYRALYPLDDGYESRRELYNLYHVLNHHNLFGGHYGDQAEAMIRRLLVGF